MLHPLGPAHVRDMDQTVDSGLDLNEGAEGSEVADRSIEFGSRGILHGEGQPRVLLDLLHSQGDLLVFRVYLQDYRFNLVADSNELGGMAYVSGPGHLGDVNQSFHTLLQFHESAIVGDRYDLANDPNSNGVLLVDFRPGVRQELLQPQ